MPIETRPIDNPEALFEEGKKFYFSGRDSANDPLMALSYFERAANLDFAPAQRLLGVCLLEGQITPRNIPQALYWLERADKRGDPQATFSLARMYAQGLGVAKDWSKAYRLLHKPGAVGLPEAKALAIRLKEELWSLYPNLLAAISQTETEIRSGLNLRNQRFVQSFLTPGRVALDLEEFDILLALNLGQITPENALTALRKCLTHYYQIAQGDPSL
ncbi:MAG: sel1 repeat family protein [Deltaproteobacteria bacterium]|jgi:hypothetical protein|nr:sel1 repeat family protein [Deltaproteobacteria bacterium]